MDFSGSSFKKSIAQGLFLGEPNPQHLPSKTWSLSPRVALVICNSFVPIILALNHSWGHFKEFPSYPIPPVVQYWVPWEVF